MGPHNPCMKDAKDMYWSVLNDVVALIWTINAIVECKKIALFSDI